MKNAIKCLSFILLVLAMIFLGLLLHELSHAVVLILLGDSISEISIGTQLYVMGEIKPYHIPFIAMASLVLPAIFVFMLSFIKIRRKTVSKYFSYSLFFLSGTPFMNNIINLIVLFLNPNNTQRPSWDLLFAIDHSSNNGKIICIIMSIICAVISMISICKYGKKFYDVL